MSNSPEETPLLGPSQPQPSQRPSSSRSRRSGRSHESTESTPLLSRQEDESDHEVEGPFQNGGPSPAASWLRAIQERIQRPSVPKEPSPRRWPSIVALVLLTGLVFAIMALGFFAPAVVEEYAKDAAVFEPTKLSIDSFTATGVLARVQGTFVLDASRVRNNAVRNLGRAGTWVARKIEAKESKVRVYLPEYNNVLLGTATIPGVVVSIRNGEKTLVDIIAHVEPGEIDGIRTIANDWLEGNLKQLRVLGKADVGLQSGLIPLGTQSVAETLVFEGQSLYSSVIRRLQLTRIVLTIGSSLGQSLPAIPKYNITRLNFREVPLPEHRKGMAADVSLIIPNNYPVQFLVPPLRFDISVPSCTPSDPFILLADATTEEIQIEPQEEVQVNVGGLVRQLPDTLTRACPNSNLSPLDLLLGDFLRGNETTIYVRGSHSPSPDTPKWISDLLSSVTVPVPFPGRTFDNLIRNFTLTDVHFSLPDPLAEPDTPEANPRLSAIVKVLVALPKEMNFPINVSHVRAYADVYYHGKKLGNLDLSQWQKANSTRISDEETDLPELVVEASVEDAPLDITDDDVFTDVIQELLFGGEGVVLAIKADVDVKVEAALGNFPIRDIPAEGKVVVKPISKGFGSFSPKIGSLKIIETSKTSLTLQAAVNITNPTEYSAKVPYVNINILSNDTILGYVTTKDLEIVPGDNDNVVVEAVWDPVTPGGKKGQDLGRNFLSQYISGRNMTVTFKTHKGTFPSYPALGIALSSLEIELPAPRIGPPKRPDDGGDGDGDDGGDDREGNGPHFIKDATMHLLSSTAVFTLISPLQYTTIYITSINATAFYNHTQPVGRIVYDLPFAVDPGTTTESPRLPVDWALGDAGYEAVKDALGGTLKLDAKAEAGVKIGKWGEVIHFEGKGIGAKVRL